MKIYIIFKNNIIYNIYRNKKKAENKVKELNDEYNIKNNYYIHQYETVYKMKEYRIEK